jgi:hypothetical protein
MNDPEPTHESEPPSWESRMGQKNREARSKPFVANVSRWDDFIETRSGCISALVMVVGLLGFGGWVGWMNGRTAGMKEAREKFEAEPAAQARRAEQDVEIARSLHGFARENLAEARARERVRREELNRMLPPDEAVLADDEWVGFPPGKRVRPITK